MEFTLKQKSIILGSMLGDGCLDKVIIDSRNSRFVETHGMKQYGYLVWKQKQLEPLHSKIRTGQNKSGFDSSDDKKRCYDFCQLTTSVDPFFTELEKTFYLRNKNGNYAYKLCNNRNYRIKIVPKSIQIDPLILSILYLDDGNNGIYNGAKECSIASLSFSEHEANDIILMIKKIGISYVKTRLEKETVRYLIIIQSKSYFDFIDLVKQSVPDIPDCMKYKINLINYIDYPHSKLDENQIQQITKGMEQKESQIEIAKNVIFLTLKCLRLLWRIIFLILIIKKN